MPTRQQIEALLADDPTDVFLRYTLAMECVKEEAFDNAVETFTELTNETPPYVPAFLMLAQLLTRLERIEQARSILRDGIEQARAQGNSHAAGEMGDLLASLGSHPGG